MKAWMRGVLTLAAAALIPACGSDGDSFILNVLPVPTTGTILYVGPNNVLINVSPASANVIISAIGLKNLSGNIVALDYHPTTGALYGLGSLEQLYQIDPQTGECSVVGPLIVAMTGTDFGMDVDPAANRIRVLGASEENLSLDPLGGPVVVHPAVNPAGNIVACAFAPAGTLYAIDSVTDNLVTVTPATGTVSVVGALGVDVSSAAGFDITAAGTTHAALEVGGVTGYYTVNLGTGAVTFQQVLGTGGPIRGFTLVP